MLKKHQQKIIRAYDCYLRGDTTKAYDLVDEVCYEINGGEANAEQLVSFAVKNVKLFRKWNDDGKKPSRITDNDFK